MWEEHTDIYKTNEKLWSLMILRISDNPDPSTMPEIQVLFLDLDAETWAEDSTDVLDVFLKNLGGQGAEEVRLRGKIGHVWMLEAGRWA
jgi:hypothetical protein